MSRGFVPGAVLVTAPKFALFAEQQVVFGGANCVRLNKLKNSTRNSLPARASLPSTTFLNTAKSKLSTPSERSVESTRGSLPKVKPAGAAKHSVLNHRFSRAIDTPEMDLWHPGKTFGREPPPNRVASLAWPLLNIDGKPL